MRRLPQHSPRQGCKEATAWVCACTACVCTWVAWRVRVHTLGSRYPRESVGVSACSRGQWWWREWWWWWCCMEWWWWGGQHALVLQLLQPPVLPVLQQHGRRHGGQHGGPKAVFALQHLGHQAHRQRLHTSRPTPRFHTPAPAAKLELYPPPAQGVREVAWAPRASRVELCTPSGQNARQGGTHAPLEGGGRGGQG
jgi:hypothetical protein